MNTPLPSATKTIEIKDALIKNLLLHCGRSPEFASLNDWYTALAFVVRERIYENVEATLEQLKQPGTRFVAYLSAEFLIGPHLRNHLFNLEMLNDAKNALKEFGLALDDILEREEEPGLGNGGLGRLAACYLDSMATMKVPVTGYGIRYEFGIFDQTIKDGWQVEMTDKWLKSGNPWELPHPDLTFPVGFGGRTSYEKDAPGHYHVRWHPHWVVNGVAYDTPISGYRSKHTSLLRLWKAEAVESFDFAAFNSGDYYRAVHEKIDSENISKVLYPNDQDARGKRLRLEQQYFFVSCTLQDLLRLCARFNHPLNQFHEKITIQLNDTHPAIAIPELMRLLMDIHHMEWDEAWDVTRSTFNYTNHTLLPEALEKWPVALFESLLPRHLEIIYEINRRFLNQIPIKHRRDADFIRRVSLIDESGERYIRMAHLACVGSRFINGVAELHSELLKTSLFKDFHDLNPNKFKNITNGVTPRRFVGEANPDLTDLISKQVGDQWLLRTETDLPKLEKFAGDASFQASWRGVKLNNKVRLAKLIQERTGVVVNPDSIFDIHVKRIHEYKRQHLNILRIIYRYVEMKANPSLTPVPRTMIFGGKAAPGYFMAKLIIKLINSVAEVINHDPAVKDQLKVVFFPDFNVKNAEFIYPAADVSEQISTAGMEASGTGNMKFALNGALTIGTLDGANVEIRKAVGPNNFFLFGLSCEEVSQQKNRGYVPRQHLDNNPLLNEAFNLLSSGYFSRNDPSLFKPLVDNLLDYDPFLVLADFASYNEAHEKIDKTFTKSKDWTKMSILNVARSGRFSSDRAIGDYLQQIWRK